MKSWESARGALVRRDGAVVRHDWAQDSCEAATVATAQLAYYPRGYAFSCILTEEATFGVAVAHSRLLVPTRATTDDCVRTETVYLFVFPTRLGFAFASLRKRACFRSRSLSDTPALSPRRSVDELRSR